MLIYRLMITAMMIVKIMFHKYAGVATVLRIFIWLVTPVVLFVL